MAIGNDSIQSNLMEVRGLQLQHFEDASTVDLVCGLSDLLRCTICAAEASVDELLAIFVKQIEGVKVGA